MTVRAKFKVSSIKRSMATRPKADGSGYEPCEGQTITMVPVVRGSEENQKFFSTTPSGLIEFFTVNELAYGQFNLDTEYVIEFTPVT